VPLHRLVEGLVHGHMKLVDASRSEPGGEPFLVETGEVRGDELLELQSAEGRLNVNPNSDLVAVKGALPHRTSHRTL
jgi:hypothetical protein